jgi:hypothetical protein
MVQDKLDIIEFTQPTNTLKVQLIDTATGNVDYETEITNSVSGVLAQIANHYYKYFANNANLTYGHGYPGNSDIYLWLYDTDFGINGTNGYANIFKFRGIAEGYDTVRDVMFYVTAVLDMTHLQVYPYYSTRQMQVGDVLTQTAARDVTAGIPFSIQSVTDGTHIVVNNTTGMNPGDTISQYPTYVSGLINYAVSTTITTVTDATHLVVGNSVGFNSVSTTITQIVSDNQVAVVSTTGWSATDEGDHVTGFNYQNALAITGDPRSGTYLPNFPGTGFQRNRAFTYVYEWGTSQANGTISAVSYNQGFIPQATNNGSAFMIGRVPEMTNLPWYQYLGWFNGAQKQLYFVSQSGGLGSTLNNMVVVNHNDFSLVQQKTLARGATQLLYGINSLKDMVYTAIDGYIYGVYNYTTGNPNTLFMQRVLDVTTAQDTTAPLTFTIVTVADLTHMTVNNTSGMSPGDTLTQGSATTTITTVVDSTHLVVGNTTGFNVMQFGIPANDTTHSVPFILNYIPNGSQMYISNSAGMSNGDTITQGTATTTITSISSANLINVGSTAGFTDGTFKVNYSTQFGGNFIQFSGGTPRTFFSDNNFIYSLIEDNQGQSVAMLTINPLTIAVDSTVNVPFSVTTVTDLTHLVVTNTTGMHNGDTITQNGHTTTITTVTDATHLVVGTTTGWVVTSAIVARLPANMSTAITTGAPLMNICPVTGKLMYVNMGAGQTAGYIYEWPSILSPNQNVAISYWPSWSPDGIGENTGTFIMYQDGSDRLVGACEQPGGRFWELSRGNYLTYATLPSPITKSNTQSLRIQYTLNF